MVYTGHVITMSRSRGQGHVVRVPWLGHVVRVTWSASRDLMVASLGKAWNQELITIEEKKAVLKKSGSG